MPYFISDSADGCSGWATIKDDGEVIGCHITKQAAIDQMVAVSIAEGMEPGGERALPNNYRPALAADVPDGRACGNCYFYDETNVRGDKAWCEKWDDYVSGAYYCNAWQPDEEDNHDEMRAPAPPKDQITGSDENKPGSASGAGGDIKIDANTETALRNKVTAHNDAMTERDRPDWTRTTFGQLSAVYRRGAGAFSVSHRPGVTRGQWAMARVNAYLYLLRTGAPENKNYVTDNDLLPESHPRSSRRSLRAPSVPQYIRAAAVKGLEYNRAGRAGDGLTDQTLREARLLADGTVSDDKIVRAAAWGARHAVDLEAAKNSNGNDREFPGAGAVAHYLWGINPLDPMPARDWFERQADMIKEANRGSDMTKIETREIQVSDLELREAPSGGMTFRGYAAVFNSDSQPLPFIEQISPGAFKRSLSTKNNVKMFVNHDDTMVLATTRANTLRLSEDGRGLIAEADLPETSYGRDLSVLMTRGDVDSMSFGFSVPSGGDQWSNDGSRRTLNEVRIHEVSVVTGFPAYEATTATVRKLQHLATRTATDADALADAMAALESGELTDDQAGLLRSVVDKIVPESVSAPTAPLSVLSQKLELMLKAV